MAQTLGGRYRIERPVGRGGLTDVYEAVDITLERRVAVKVLHEELEGEPVVRQLFEEAARGAAALSHPNIVSVLDFGEDEGISFVVTDWVDEPTLAAAVANGPLQPLRVAEIGVDVASALAAAHDHGILHRGLKPSDIFVGAEGEAKVSDFGVTRAAERARTLDREARMAEATYVSPERAQGRPADPRTDVYGLGLVMYEAATGRPAASGSSPAEIASQHLDQYPPRPREVNPDVPAELEAVMARMLAKNPDARWPNAGVVAQELQGLLDSGVLVPAGYRPTLTAPAAAGAAAVMAPAAQPPRENYDDEYYEPEEEPIAAAAAAAAAGAAAAGVAGGAAGGGQTQLVRIDTNDATTTMPQTTPYRYDDQRRRPPWILWAGLGGLLLVIILIAIALTRSGGGGTPTVRVADVRNRTQDEAVAALIRQGLRSNPVSLPNESVAPGIVYAQEPPPGAKVRKGATINLSVSSGPIETTTTTTTPATTTVTQKRTTTTRRQVTTTRPRVSTTVRTVPRTTTPTTAPATTVTTVSTSSSLPGP